LLVTFHRNDSHSGCSSWIPPRIGIGYLSKCAKTTVPSVITDQKTGARYCLDGDSIYDGAGAEKTPRGFAPLPIDLRGP
jgi:hypothetical protein